MVGRPTFHIPSTIAIMIRDESAFEAQVALDSIAAVSAAVNGLPSHITTAAHVTSSSAQPVPGLPEPRKKEVSSEKVRIENRERKKRWREQNEERSKCYSTILFTE